MLRRQDTSPSSNRFDARGQGEDHGVSFEARQTGSDAMVDAAPETEVIDRIAGDVEAIRGLVVPLVAVGRSEQHRNACSLGQRDAVELDRARRQSRESLDRRLEAQDLVERRRHERAVGPHELPLVGMRREQPHGGRKGVHRRVHPGPRVGEHQARARVGLDVATLPGGVDLAPPTFRLQPLRRREAGAVVVQLAEPDERTAQQFVVRPERVERRRRPTEEVLASFVGEPDEVGDQAHAVGLGEVGDGVEGTAFDEVGDHRLGP